MEDSAPVNEQPPIVEENPGKVKRFIKECVRVLRITKKPSKEEYWTHAKVTALGIAIIGALGFIVFLLAQAF